MTAFGKSEKTLLHATCLFRPGTSGLYFATWSYLILEKTSRVGCFATLTVSSSHDSLGSVECGQDLSSICISSLSDSWTLTIQSWADYNLAWSYMANRNERDFCLGQNSFHCRNAGWFRYTQYGRNDDPFVTSLCFDICYIGSTVVSRILAFPRFPVTCHLCRPVLFCFP